MRETNEKQVDEWYYRQMDTLEHQAESFSAEEIAEMKKDVTAEIAKEREIFKKKEDKLVKLFIVQRDAVEKKRVPSDKDIQGLNAFRDETDKKMEKMMSKFESYRRDVLMSWSETQDQVSSSTQSSTESSTKIEEWRRISKKQYSSYEAMYNKKIEWASKHETCKADSEFASTEALFLAIKETRSEESSSSQTTTSSSSASSSSQTNSSSSSSSSSSTTTIVTSSTTTSSSSSSSSISQASSSSSAGRRLMDADAG